MPATVIVGLQWGDEGKGKTTDALAENVTAVVRYQGGDNAGHTIMLGEEVFKLHLVPSGVLYPHIVPIIGNGVVINPATLITELDMLASRGIEVDRVRVSKHAHVIMPYHIALDGAMEARLAKAAVEGNVIRHDHVGVLADADPIHLDAAAGEHVQLRDQSGRIDHNTVADDRDDVGIQHARRDEVKLEDLLTQHDRVAGVVAALVSDDGRDILGQGIGGLALALVAPLKADDHGGGHLLLPSWL